MIIDNCLEGVRAIHFIGIGGIGMSALAELLHRWGYRVSGSDLRFSPLTRRLARQGITCYQGHTAAHLGEVDLVVYSAAIPPSNPERERARQRSIPTLSRAELLAAVMATKKGIAIAGTHGKTTTTAMISHTLIRAGLDPTVLIGGIAHNLGTNVQVGQGLYLVSEADEFDRSFLRLAPHLAVITNIETDHLDCYRDLTDIEESFIAFIRRIRPGGRLVIWDQVSILQRLPLPRQRWVTYGLESRAQIRGEGLRQEGRAWVFDAYQGDTPLTTIRLRLPGRHNALNALATLAVALQVGITAEQAGCALASFQGVARRFERKGEAGGIVVVDDYAHHPTELMATLTSARESWPGRIVAVFQPHLYSRTRDFYQGFGKALTQADAVIVTAIYPAREQPIAGVTAELIVQATRQQGHPQVVYCADKQQVIAHLVRIARAGDLVITLGAGDVGEIGGAFLARLGA